MLLKYLKLKTIRILREKYLDDWTCIAVYKFFSGFLMQFWYRKQVKEYAMAKNVSTSVPFTVLAFRNFDSEQNQRDKFLTELEQKVQKGLA